MLDEPVYDLLLSLGKDMDLLEVLGGVGLQALRRGVGTALWSSGGPERLMLRHVTHKEMGQALGRWGFNPKPSIPNLRDLEAINLLLQE